MKQVVYVASPESQQIGVWQLDEQGRLTLLQTVSVVGQGQPMAISPDRRHLYIGVRPDFAVVTYRIGVDGKLDELNRAELPASPTHISTDLHGRFLFSASYSGNCVSISPIDSQGRVDKWTQQVSELMAPHSVNVDPIHQTLLVPCLKEDQIRLFDLDIDGKLTPHPPGAVQSAKGAGPRHMAFHPNNQVVYCVNELNGTVDVYRIADHANKYNLIQTLNAMPANFDGTCWAADIHITPNGRYLYISDRTTSLLAIFNVAQGGMALSLIGHQQTEAQPRGFNIDDSGNFLLAAGQKSDHIAVYRIEQVSGQLTQLARYSAGKGPMWISVLALQD